VPFQAEWSGNRVTLGVAWGKRVQMPFRHCRKASDRIVLAGPWGTKDLDTVGLERGMDSDLSSHSDRSDRHRLVGSAADIDSEDWVYIRGARLVDWDSQDRWNRDFLVALGWGTGYLDKENSLRIAAAGFDKGHTIAEDSPAWMDILVPSGNADWNIRFVGSHPFVRRKDWQ